MNADRFWCYAPTLFGIAWFVLVPLAIAGDADSDGLLFKAQRAYAAKQYIEAADYYRGAANLGSPVALFQLGGMYERGEGVVKDISEAVRWYERAVYAGSAAAAKNLAGIYFDGNGVSKDLEKAAYFYTRAGDLGDSNSYYTLGLMYWMGSGVIADSRKAVELFLKAAKKRNPMAMNALGVAYEAGDGAQKNIPYAYAYFKLAHEFGDKFAAENFDGLVKKITAHDRESGEILYIGIRNSLDKK